MPSSSLPGAAALAAGLIFGPASAEELQEAETGTLLEMAGHRALARTRARAPDPAPFQTDGCSGGMSASWALAAQVFSAFEARHGVVPPWQDCCVTHDRAYHSAGPDISADASFQARLSADEVLRACVVSTAELRLEELATAYGTSEDVVLAGYRLVSDAMFQAVRTGGAPCSGLPWRWGYGYPGCIVQPQDFRVEDDP
ncbi:MAG: hypothetical protein AAGA28_08670 [Pseudomonadota bacterium]